MNHTRRSLLAAGATVGVVGVAGCSGGGGGGGSNQIDTGQYDCDLSEPSDPDLDYRPTLGNPDADVTVQVFEDFTCGHCASYTTDHFPTIREEYVDTGDVHYQHWDFPIPVNEQWAVPVASAARGVGVRNGDEAFFEFAATAYESQGNYSGEAVGAAAEAAGADPCAAIADAQFSTYEEAAPVEGGYGADTVAAAIDAEL